MQNFRRLAYIGRSGISISYSSFLGKGVKIYQGVNNGKKGEVKIGDKTAIEDYAILHAYGGSIFIDKNSFIGPHCVLYGHGKIHIGQNCLVAMHTCIISANHSIPPRHLSIRSLPDIRKEVIIEDDVWVGAGVKILSGVKVGKGAVIGAGSVVTKDLPPYSISVGNPAKVIKYRNEE